MLTDTHAHLYLEHFENDIETVIQNAKNNSIGKVYLPNIDNSTIEKMLYLESIDQDFFRSMIGLHPGSVNENFRAELDTMQSMIDNHRFCGIGETGTDLYWDRTFINEQIEAFETQIDWAQKYQLPVIIHARDSMDLTIDIVKNKQDGSLKGIFHCFSGNIEQAKKIIDLGFYLGIGGVLTYKNNELAVIVKELPLDYFVLETDAPYLTPVPFRGKRNESSYLKYVAQKMSEIKKLQVDELENITSKNAENIFSF
ncbi:MAG: TatD family hydrolase [Saprospiraceae bacterium]|nr:TatD family hydrolase [Saprospiraceae bacterium]